jgi:rSAM/selenodomain-associated transferase 1
MSRPVLGVFAKFPEPGQVKTRLAAETTPAWAAGLALAFLLDTLDRVSAVDVARCLVFSPPGAESAFENYARGRFTLSSQGKGDLGQRLERFFAGRFREGAESVVAIGSDSPTLPCDFLRLAFQELEQQDLVLGPATDGGYYLLGCGRADLPARVFENISWGTSEVLNQTISRLEGYSSRLVLLSPWYDVDSLEDCHMLKGHLAALRCAGIDPEVPRTEALLNADGSSTAGRP